MGMMTKHHIARWRNLLPLHWIITASNTSLPMRLKPHECTRVGYVAYPAICMNGVAILGVAYGGLSGGCLVLGCSVPAYLHNTARTPLNIPLTIVDLGNGFQVSTAVILPFLAASRATLSEEFDGWLAALAFTEGLLGLVFIFLIGLTLRNRFRIWGTIRLKNWVTIATWSSTPNGKWKSLFKRLAR